MSIDTMHSLFKTGERLLQLTHQLLNPPLQMQPALLDELLADPDTQLSALLSAILDGIVGLESQAALGEEQATDPMLRGSAFPNPALPITWQPANFTSGELPPLPAPFRPTHQENARPDTSAPPLSPGLLQVMADLNIPLPGTRPNGVNWPSAPDNRGRSSGSAVAEIKYPAAGQLSNERLSQARMRFAPAEHAEAGSSNFGDLPAMPQNRTSKPIDRREFDGQVQWPLNDENDMTGAPVSDYYGHVNNITGQTGWNTASEREAETAARLPYIDTDGRPVVSRSVSGAAKIASVLRANISNPSLPQQGSPEFAGHEFAGNERRDLEAGEIGAKAGESWAKPAPPLQRQAPTAANIGEATVRREILPDRTNDKAHDQTNEVDLEKLVEQLADYLEFEFQRTYGTSGGAL
jgi:hypothetical protein